MLESSLETTFPMGTFCQKWVWYLSDEFDCYTLFSLEIFSFFRQNQLVSSYSNHRFVSCPTWIICQTRYNSALHILIIFYFPSWWMFVFNIPIASLSIFTQDIAVLLMPNFNPTCMSFILFVEITLNRLLSSLIISVVSPYPNCTVSIITEIQSRK